ncbi:MAG: ATP-binding protein [Candidatus Geothermincolia bacterium]
MDIRGYFSRNSTPSPDGGYLARGDISHLLFVTARPGLQLLWTVLVAATFIFTMAHGGPKHPAMTIVMLTSYAAVVIGNHFFPFDEYHPFLFLLLMAAFLALTASIVFLTGGRDSLLGFLFFAVPILSSAYYGYPGTLVMSLLTVVVRYIPFMSGNVTAIEHLSLALTALAYIFVGVMSCYVVEGEKMYARESSEYRHLLELSRHRERDVSRIYNLSRRFSYTLDLDTILKTTAALARQMLACEGVLVLLVEDGRPVLKAALGILPFSDLAAVNLPTDSSWPERLSAGESIICQKVALDWLPLPPEASGRNHNIAAVPLFMGGDVAGHLLCFSELPRPFRESHLEILSTITSQAAVAVEKARLYARTLEDKTKVETILGALRDGLVLTDAHGKLVEANPVAEQMLALDVSPEPTMLKDVLSRVVVGSNLGHLTVDDALESVLEGRVVFGEMTVAGDTRVTVQSLFIPLRDQVSRVSGMVLFLHDITELKRVDEMKSNFVSNVSHELRTPLTSISGFVSLLLAGRAGPLTSNQNKYLEVVKQQAAYLTKMIEDLLDLSRLQAKSVKAESRTTHLQEIAAAAVEELSRPARDGDVEVRLRLREDLPAVNADPTRISQVFSNVIGNAIKFCGPGGLVEITAHSNGPYVQVQVSDNGVGISPAALPHIFDRFFQAHQSDASDPGGFGLGLAISREIVELHGGRIWAESAPGRGSSFYFTIPVSAETTAA